MNPSVVVHPKPLKPTVLDFNAEAAYTASIFVTIKMLANYIRWEINPELRGDFVKRVSHWQNTTLGPGMQITSNIHSPPEVVAVCLGNLLNNFEGAEEFHSAKEFHIDLLHEASEEILKMVEQGRIGASSMEKIK